MSALAERPGLPRRLKQAVAALLVLGVGGFLIDGADRPANPHLVVPAGGTGPGGFGTVSFTVDRGGVVKGGCALAATTADQQARGLMGRRSLGGFAGMVFEFGSPTSVDFYMKDTPMPLSVAWFGTGGVYLSSTDMQPCVDVVCPTYGAGAPFSLAMEVPQGRLGAYGVGPGSVLHVGGACSP